METIYPPSSTERVGMRPWGWKPLPSKDFSVFHDFRISEEPMVFQQDKDKAEVEAASSITVLKTFFPTTLVMT